MLRFNRLVLVLGICLCVGAALGAAIKIKGLTPVGLGVNENPEGDGMAILNYHQGNNQTEVTVAITDFIPETDYHITVFPGTDDAPVTTNPAGNANTHQVVDYDVVR